MKCPHCLIEFAGRKTRKYCSEKCKAACAKQKIKAKTGLSYSQIAISKGLCSHCHSRPKGLGRTCSECKERKNAWQFEKRIAIRKQVLDHYGHECQCCKEKRAEFLAIDHINGNGNQHRKENNLKGSSSLYNWIIKNNYPIDLQILCHNCNSAKGFYGVSTREGKIISKIKRDGTPLQ